MKIMNVHRHWEALEQLHSSLKKEPTVIQRSDYGAKKRRHYAQRLDYLARISSSPGPQMTFLSALAAVAESKNILEMGTCLGLGTAYLVEQNPSAQIVTLEGDPALAALARKHWSWLHLSGIKLVVGPFADTLPSISGPSSRFDFIFMDGHHDGQAMIAYWAMLKPQFAEEAIICIDDIRWSSDMYDFWLKIAEDPQVSISIDAGKFGLIQLVNSPVSQKNKYRWNLSR